ncbi:MAG: NUDIX hydrolase [Leptolyngbya sp. SIO3F4]|nr:NUDIX hydrolase [Leptolyngbya sp. SIO3F4]
MKKSTYKYPRAQLAVDCVVFGLDESQGLKVLLIKRLKEPCKGEWALPGGFVRPDQDNSLEDAALRELKEETRISELSLEQLYTFGNRDRHPGDWVATVAYYALVNLSEYLIHADTDASAVAWFLVKELPPLAFDHNKIINTAVQRLRAKVRYEPIGFNLLPRKFTVPQLQNLYETILDIKFDRRNFLRKFRKMNLLVELDEMQEGVSHRPARLYQFDSQEYENLKQTGFNFEI